MAEDISEGGCSENCDYESLKNHIKGLLRKYFEFDDSGNKNKEYNPDFSAQDFVEDIHGYVGDI